MNIITKTSPRALPPPPPPPPQHLSVLKMSSSVIRVLKVLGDFRSFP